MTQDVSLVPRQKWTRAWDVPKLTQLTNADDICVEPTKLPDPHELTKTPTRDGMSLNSPILASAISKCAGWQEQEGSTPSSLVLASTTCKCASYPEPRYEPAPQDQTKAAKSLNSLRTQHEPCCWPIPGDATKLCLNYSERPMTTDTDTRPLAGMSLNSQACDCVNRRTNQEQPLEAATCCAPPHQGDALW